MLYGGPGGPIRSLSVILAAGGTWFRTRLVSISPRRKCISHACMQMFAYSHTGHTGKHTLTCAQTGANAAQWLLFHKFRLGGPPAGVASSISKAQRGLCARQGRDRHPSTALPMSRVQSLVARPHAPPWKWPDLGCAQQPTQAPSHY